MMTTRIPRSTLSWMLLVGGVAVFTIATGRSAAQVPPDEAPSKKAPAASSVGVKPSVAQPPSAVKASLSGETLGGNDGAPRAPILDPGSSRISFQALLTDDLGEPLPGPTVDLSFMIYTALLNPVEGPIVLNGVPISGGVVDVLVPVSASSFDGNLRKLGVSVDGGAELSPPIEFGAVPYAFRVDRVESEELTDNVELGDPATSGSLTAYDSTSGAASIFLDGSSNQIRIFGNDGDEHAALWGFDFGQLYLDDDNGDTTAGMRALSIGGSGANLFLSDETGLFRCYAEASTDGGSLTLYDGGGASVINLDATAFGGGLVDVRNDAGESTVQLDGSVAGGGLVDVRNSTGSSRILLNGNSAQISTYGGDGLEQIRLWGTGFGEIFLYDGSVSNDQTVRLSATSNSGGELHLFRNDGATEGVTLFGGTTSANSGGEAHFWDASGTETITLDAEEDGGGGGGILAMFNQNGTQTIEVDADEGDHAALRLWDSGAVNTVEIEAREGSTGGQIVLRDAAGAATIILDAEFGAGGDGRITTEVLEITGGSDLSEQFDVQATGGEVQPGMVVGIDPDRPGRLRVCDRAYDRTVAGIISGAGGVRAGMLMGQRESEADGQWPVALTGRVYCLAEASNGPIRPGDLLTTSNTPGHCMKVAEHARGQGAIIGKAMTSLENGAGLVLVLVALQ